MESILISGHTHPGLRRSANQDACIMQHLRAGDKALAVVIDGVGGYAGGERAAAIAKDCIEQYMQTPSGDTLTMLREAVIFANNQIAAERKKDQRYGEMCCVLTAMVADVLAQRIYFVHVGDTRLYRYRDGNTSKTHPGSFLCGYPGRCGRNVGSRSHGTSAPQPDTARSRICAAPAGRYRFYGL